MLRSLQLAREQPNVVCVQATTEDPNTWLLKKPFRQLAEDKYGRKSLTALAEILGSNKSSLSLFLRQRRPASGPFLAACMEAFPGIPTQHYISPRRTEVTE